jgi:hypothetical protein
MIMCDEPLMIWKDEVMAYFTVILMQFHVETKKFMVSVASPQTEIRSRDLQNCKEIW